jgi:hypothetical protein
VPDRANQDEGLQVSVVSRSPRPAWLADAAPLSRAVVVWLALIAVEIVHGAVRARSLVPRVGDLRSRQIGVFTGSALILVVAHLAAPWLRAPTPRLQARVGGLWLGLTLAFEVGFGRFVLRASWGRIASDYDPRRGGLLPVGLLVLALAPWLTSRSGRPATRRSAGRRTGRGGSGGAGGYKS